MYLKAIELHGFKSFPDKTKVTFQEGMTAVVGPNGSGKSNISDAIRWVLGETRSKELRGSGKMEDIIFGGTQKRNPMGYASVSLILDNSKRGFDVDGDEVSITRKYYRGGESEYLINSNKVRLKDIHELFFDTGLGKNGYSIVSQGKISEIVTSKPEDRREIFEEASGIAKFRYKRNEAERSLSNAQDNIFRLTDILLGLEDRVEPLRKESEKAKEFIELSNNKKELEISLWIDTIEQSKELIRTQQRHLEVFQADYDSINITIEQKEKYIEERYLEGNRLLAKNDENINSIRVTEQEIAQKNSSKAVLESQITYNNQRQADYDIELANFNSENNTNDEKINEILKNINILEDDRNEKLQEQSSIEHELELISLNALNADKEKGELIQNINIVKQDIQNTQLLMYKLNTQNDALNDNIFKAQNIIDSNKDNQIQTEKQVKELNEFIEVAQENIQRNLNIKNGLSLKLNTVLDKFEKLNEQVRQNVAKQNETSNRIKLLTDMENSLEGFALSVKNVLNQSKNGALNGILGSVAQLINVEKGYETAIEISLGYALQNIVVENETSAKHAMEYLKNTRGGRATFLPLDTIKPANFNENLPDYAKTADTIIKTDAKYKNVISNLLGRTIIVDDINQASRLAKTLNFRYRIVTIDGQQINAGGSFTGGSVSKSAGLFSRKGEIEKLKKALYQLQEDNKINEQELIKIKESKAVIETQIMGCDNELETLNQDKVTANIELAKFTQVLNQYIQSEEVNLNILETSKSQITNNLLEKQNLEVKLTQLEEDAKIHERKLDNLGVNDDEIFKKQTLLTAQLQDIKLEIVKIQGNIQIKTNNLDMLKMQLKQQEDRQKLLVLEIDNLKQDTINKQNEIENLQQDVVNLKEFIANKEQENKQFVDIRMGIEQERNALNTDNKKLLNQKEEISKQIIKVSEKIKNMEISYDEIITKLWEEYELTVQFAKEFAVPLVNEAQTKKDLANIKSLIKKLGNVNVGAIEEYKEVYEKYTFLKDQLNDLEQSKTQLLKLINSLSAEMKMLFSESFAIIDENFSRIFTELFGGGSAKLILTDPENILDSGVEIEVSPPGKVIKSLKSLSGGEQALVAISLYFGILAHNPAPFCVLDEIEAALDDVNVTRYASYLKRISDQTQFIVITHRRGTMEAADVLYGVTMQEDGISKLLKLDVNNLSPSMVV